MATESKAFEWADANESREIEIGQTVQKQSAHLRQYGLAERYHRAAVLLKEDAKLQGYLHSVGILFVNESEVDIDYHHSPIPTESLGCLDDSQAGLRRECTGRIQNDHEALCNNECVINDRVTENLTTMTSKVQENLEEDGSDELFSRQDDSDSDSDSDSASDSDSHSDSDYRESYAQVEHWVTYIPPFRSLPPHVINPNYRWRRNFPAIFPVRHWPTHESAMQKERDCFLKLGVNVEDAVITETEEKLMDDQKLWRWRCKPSSLRRSWTYC